MPVLIGLAIVALFALASGEPMPREASGSGGGAGGGDLADLPADIRPQVAAVLAACASGGAVDTGALDALAQVLRDKGFGTVAARVQGCADGARTRAPSPAPGLPPLPEGAGFPPAPPVFSPPAPGTGPGMIAAAPLGGGGAAGFAGPTQAAKDLASLGKLPFPDDLQAQQLYAALPARRDEAVALAERLGEIGFAAQSAILKRRIAETTVGGGAPIFPVDMSP